MSPVLEGQPFDLGDRLPGQLTRACEHDFCVGVPVEDVEHLRALVGLGDQIEQHVEASKIVAVGLAAYGLYLFVEARYRRVRM